VNNFNNSIMTETVQLDPIEEGKEIENIYGATLKRSLVYAKNVARPGYCWFIFDINAKTYLKKKGEKIDDTKKYKKLQGGLQIEKDFVEKHGEENVKNMIIVNVLNKRRFFK